MCDFIIMDELILQAYQMNTNKLSDLSVRLMRTALNNVQNQNKTKKRGQRETVTTLVIILENVTHVFLVAFFFFLKSWARSAWANIYELSPSRKNKLINFIDMYVNVNI